MGLNTRLGYSQGIAGWYVVCYDAKTGEPIQTGIGRYKTVDEAVVEAHQWASAEGMSELRIDQRPTEGART